MPSQKDTTKSLPGYDRVLKEAFDVDGSMVLDRIASGQRISSFVNPELPATLERRADLIAMIGRKRLLHVELQATNQADMPYREGIYGFLIGYKYRRLIDQAVLYVGEEPMNMESRPGLGSVTVEYR